MLQPAALPRLRVGRPGARLIGRARRRRVGQRTGGKCAVADLLGDARQQPQQACEKIQDQVTHKPRGAVHAGNAPHFLYAEGDAVDRVLCD